MENQKIENNKMEYSLANNQLNSLNETQDSIKGKFNN